MFRVPVRTVHLGTTTVPPPDDTVRADDGKGRARRKGTLIVVLGSSVPPVLTVGLDNEGAALVEIELHDTEFVPLLTGLPHTSVELTGALT